MKRMKNYSIPLIVCSLAVLLLTACKDELGWEQVPEKGRGISFSASVTNGWDTPPTTRGTLSTGISEPVQMEGGGQTFYLQASVLDGIMMQKKCQSVQATTRGAIRTASNMYDAIGVMAYSFSGSWDGSRTPDFMCNLKASKGSSVYETTTYWPSSETNIRFYAYAPYSADADGITLSSASVAGVPMLAYEVPEDVADQSDLLATLCDETASAAHTSPQAMELHHLLTAVCFKTGDNMAAGTIGKITLKNIKYKGTYTFPAATPWATNKGDWAIDSDVKDFTCSPAFNTTGTANVQVNTGESVFMMLPQTLTGDASVEVEFTASGESTAETYSCYIKDLASWEQGKTVTYTISITPNSTKYFLNVSLDKNTYSCEGEDGTLTITSYKETAGTKEAVEWTIIGFSTDDGSTWRESPSTNLKDNEVIDFADVTGTGGDSPQDQTFSIYNTDYETTIPKTSDLTDATPAVDVDLSLYDVEGNSISRSTANCYVVRAPGTYKFPVVYGNGIVNGVETDEGYKSIINPDTFTVFTYPAYDVYLANGTLWYHNDGGNTVTAATKRKYTLIDFPNSYGDVITNSWIHKNSHSGSPLTPTTAELVWSDAENLIRTENVSLTQSGDEYYVNFEIKKDDIVEGNALIQVKGTDDTVLWSWHIWVTNADFSQTKTITAAKANNRSYTFMAVPLGCIDESNASYDYAVRDMLIKVRQSESNKVAIVRLSQPAQVISDRVIYVTNYQWGRKDPFPYKDVSGLVKQSQGGVATRIAMYEAIQHPNTLYLTSSGNISSWHRSNAENFELSEAGSEGICNLWDINLACTGYKAYFWDLFYALQYVSKTIYDPCPVGYHVGDGYAYVDFSQEPASGVQANRDTGTPLSGIGKTFHAKNGTADVDVFIPITNRRGCASSSGEPQYKSIGSSIYWTSAYSIPIVAGGIYYLARSYDQYSKYSGGNAADAYAVYPIKDNGSTFTYNPSVDPWDDSTGEISVTMSE